MKLSTMKGMAWRCAVNVMMALVCGILMLLTLCLVLILGPLCLITEGWKGLIKRLAIGEIEKSYCDGYKQGLKDMADPPHLIIGMRGVSPTVAEDVRKVMSRVGRRFN